MSNYPPGVTGLEPEIVGYDEEELTRTVECDHEISGHYPGMGDYEEPCGFEGDILGTRIWLNRYESVFHWECPRCLHEHDDIEQHDPDQERDEQ